jgi:hypothetical protein
MSASGGNGIKNRVGIPRRFNFSGNLHRHTDLSNNGEISPRFREIGDLTEHQKMPKNQTEKEKRKENYCWSTTRDRWRGDGLLNRSWTLTRRIRDVNMTSRDERNVFLVSESFTKLNCVYYPQASRGRWRLLHKTTIVSGRNRGPLRSPG